MSRLKVMKAPREVSPVARLVDDYLASKRSEGLSSKTIEQYSYALQRVFLPFLVAEGITEPEQVTTRLLERLSSRLLETGTEGLTENSRGALSKDTVHSYLRPVRWFVRWVNSDTESGTSITGQVTLPRLPQRRILEVLSADELKAMDGAARDRSRRDELIFTLLRDSGIRVGELVLLQPSDLRRDRENYFLRIRGKGEKERMVPITPKLFRALEGLVDRQRKRSEGPPMAYVERNDEERIFGSIRRNRVTGKYEPLTTSGVEQLIRGIAEGAGITRRVYPHLLRHSLATRWLQDGHSALLLKDVLGHADLTMIQAHYGHLTHHDAAKEMARFLQGR